MPPQSKENMMIQFMRENFRDLKDDFKDSRLELKEDLKEVVAEIKKDNKEDHEKIYEKIETTLIAMETIKSRQDSIEKTHENDMKTIRRNSIAKRDWVAIAIAILAVIATMMF